MEIKDLAGLSEPLTKLIEVIAQGIGGWAKPSQIKRIANAKAYEFEQMAQVIKKHSDSLNLAEYDGEKVKLLCEQQGLPPETAQELIEMRKRTGSRLIHQEMRRQRNIEQTIRHTAEELSQEEKVSAEQVDEDWITRFFNIAEDVSNEQMQQLWGRILVGEIKKPKTYSLRTLEVLRNISPEEAEVFCKVAEYALSSSDKSFIYHDREFLEKELNINFIDLLLLRELGIIFPNELEFSFSPASKTEKSHFVYGNRILLVTRDAKTPKISLQATVFTQTGKELLNLVPQRFNKQYAEHVGKKMKVNDSVKIFHGNITSYRNGRIEYGNLFEI